MPPPQKVGWACFSQDKKIEKYEASTKQTLSHPKRICTFSLAKAVTYVFTSNNIRRCAFTLAEVLITLGIIGIVAAMTLPTIISKTQKKDRAVKLKKVYSVLSQAIQQTLVEDGTTENWKLVDHDFQATESTVKKIIPYLKVAQNCKNQRGCWAFPYYYQNGNSTNINTPNQYSYYITLADGTNIFFDIVGTTNAQLFIYTDINGNKKPNTFGDDIFAFKIKNNKIEPYSTNLDACTLQKITLTECLVFIELCRIIGKLNTKLADTEIYDIINI